jgi:serine/threonine protein kinase
MELLELLQTGSIGKVYKGTYKKEPDEVVAIKKIPNDKLKDESEHLKILQGCSGIIKLLGCEERAKYTYIITELCKGGDLIDYVQDHSISMKDIKKIIRWLLKTIQYCHSNNICHCDIKLDNIGLLFPNDLNNLRLFDFSHSVSIYDDIYYNNEDLIGTVDFCAPELLKTSFTKGNRLRAVDVASIGVLVYSLIEEKYPMDLGNENLEFTTDDVAARDFMSRLLDPNPESRITIDKALTHIFLK